MKGVISTKELDRGEALTGVARKEAEEREEMAREHERLLSLAVDIEIEKKLRAKSKKVKSGKGKKTKQ